MNEPWKKDKLQLGGFYEGEHVLRLEEELAKRAWQPIETAPKEGGIFLLWEPGGVPYIGYESIQSKQWTECSNSYHPLRVCNPTHWMPLPEPPK